jgi:hypothetical protein
VQIVCRDAVKMGVAEEPEMEPRVKYFDHKATDAYKCLVLATWKFAESEVCVLEWNPSFVEEAKEK